MIKMVLASNNQGKIREINQLVKAVNADIEIISQAQLGVDEIPETGLSFIENAIIKARHAAAITKMIAIADDSGLVVPALNGEPGIYSARYAGDKADHQENIQKLLAKLRDIPDQQRQAYFYCIIVLLRNESDPCPIICEGVWHGTILHQPRGEIGFGYDPIFFDPKEGCAAAEMPPEIKNKISHRGQAMKEMLKHINSLNNIIIA